MRRRWKIEKEEESNAQEQAKYGIITLTGTYVLTKNVKEAGDSKRINCQF